MYPLLLCSLISLTVTIERLLFWWRASKRRNEALINRIFDITEKGNFESAISAGQGAVDLVVRVLTSGLTQRDHGLRESMEVAASEEIDRAKRALAALDTIITLAPLLGILGTVLGIIESFDLLGASGIEDPKAVTGGIAQALITTAAGLSVAIATLIPFQYLVSKVQKTTRYLENIITQFEVVYKKGLGNNHASEQRVRGKEGAGGDVAAH